MVVNDILDEFSFTKWYPHVGHACLDNLSKFYIAVVLDTKEKKYAFGYGPIPYSEYVECKNLTDFHNRMVMSTAVEDANDAFKTCIRSFSNSTKDIQGLATILYNISGPELIDELTEEECKQGMEIMSRRHDDWLATELIKNDDPYLQTHQPTRDSCST